MRSEKTDSHLCLQTKIRPRSQSHFWPKFCTILKLRLGLEDPKMRIFRLLKTSWSLRNLERHHILDSQLLHHSFRTNGVSLCFQDLQYFEACDWRIWKETCRKLRRNTVATCGIKAVSHSLYVYICTGRKALYEIRNRICKGSGSTECSHATQWRRSTPPFSLVTAKNGRVCSFFLRLSFLNVCKPNVGPYVFSMCKIRPWKYSHTLAHRIPELSRKKGCSF